MTCRQIGKYKLMGGGKNMNEKAFPAHALWLSFTSRAVSLAAFAFLLFAFLDPAVRGTDC